MAVCMATDTVTGVVGIGIGIVFGVLFSLTEEIVFSGVTTGVLLLGVLGRTTLCVTL